MSTVYRACEWIPSNAFIYSHAGNRDLNPELHSHDFFEIVYLFGGSAFHKYNQSLTEMRAGEVMILRPGDTHILFRKSAELDLYSISATTEQMQPLLAAYCVSDTICAGADPFIFSLGQQKYNITRLFEGLSSLNKGQQYAHLRVILGMTIHALVLSHGRERQMWLENTLQQMNSTENLTEGVPAMQRLCNLSHAQLCRVMKKQTGKTPQQYVRELRLLRAYDLIQSTDLPFEDVANAVGYFSFSHFSTTFKERFGLTPAALRKRNMAIL